MGNRRPGYLTRYAKSRGITVRQADYQLKKCGVVTSAYFDFEEADRLRKAWTIAKDGATDGTGAEAGDRSKIGPLAEAQARERHFKAGLAELAYKERMGQLVEKQKVEEATFRKGRLVRDGLLNIPSRLAGILAAETDQRRVHDLLEVEIRQVLEALTSYDRGGTAGA